MTSRLPARTAQTEIVRTRTAQSDPTGHNQPVGVIGGIGPMATVHFMRRVIELTDAAADQDHVNLIVWQHAAIPDRSAYLRGESKDNPGTTMAADARALEAMGCRFIAIPCNTAQAFRDDIQSAVRIPVLDIVSETVAAAGRAVRNLQTIGILATDGTLDQRTYHNAATARGLSAIAPEADIQREVMSMIYDGVKAGMPVERARLETAVMHLRERGAQAIVLGCTELPILRVELGIEDTSLIDSLDALARLTISTAGAQVRSS